MMKQSKCGNIFAEQEQEQEQERMAGYMDFLEKVGETITTKGREVTDKAKDLAEIASLRGQISTCEEVIRKNYMEIGKLYYEQYKEAEYNDFTEQCTAIANAKSGVKALEEKINEIKGV